METLNGLAQLAQKFKAKDTAVMREQHYTKVGCNTSCFSDHKFFRNWNNFVAKGNRSTLNFLNNDWQVTTGDYFSKCPKQDL